MMGWGGRCQLVRGATGRWRPAWYRHNLYEEGCVAEGSVIHWSCGG